VPLPLSLPLNLSDKADNNTSASSPEVVSVVSILKCFLHADDTTWPVEGIAVRHDSVSVANTAVLPGDSARKLLISSEIIHDLWHSDNRDLVGTL
jgi:hypothetical protein